MYTTSHAQKMLKEHYESLLSQELLVALIVYFYRHYDTVFSYTMTFFFLKGNINGSVSSSQSAYLTQIFQFLVF